jgi:hypothetical protein
MGQHDGQENPRPRRVKKMNKQVDLIDTDRAFSIAEDRGWQFGATHQRLTDLAREGRLQFWGYKGNSAELLPINSRVWQNHGLDPLKGELVIPGKIFARDYAEQVWRDVHVDRQEFEAAFPDPDESGEDRCSGWLMQEMRESPEYPPKPKLDYAGPEGPSVRNRTVRSRNSGQISP